MKESVIYQDIFQKGRQQEAFELMSRFLKRKFGTIDLSILERLQAMTTEQLEQLAEDSLDFSNISDLETWLNKQSTV
ncbi:hypothetical protein NIES4071_01290 [Calothrix sp. NIES-4071]|nr:hypothetical protein NIES4071_01290 [Calothrix sp. NIES-4071]BAZ54475.1 hypothetical protein NIES4105_01280 [Calothrix sp. NIES-4105]